MVRRTVKEQESNGAKIYTVSHFITDNKKEQSTLGSSEKNHLKGRTRTGEPPLITPYQHRETT